ncbi:WhiB family transcriptional regulator [Streptomyces sp. NPDC059165]|uniref:WhiB family transcriptional regulator n=1 Tax=Streptomyces sp. NPDC059165 TaxID=3346751 RepID=UPI00367D1320
MSAWEENARCRTVGVAIFFPDGPGAQNQAGIREAKAVCAWCTVREPCLELALAREGDTDRFKRAGIWGGTTPRERAAIASRRRAA